MGIRRLLLAACLGVGLSAPTLSSPSPPAGDFFLASLPPWANRSHTLPADVPFLQISEVMRAWNLSRAQATEVQSRYRQQAAGRPGDSRDVIFSDALKTSAALSSGRLDLAHLKKSDFVIALDLDETLYDQYTAKEGCSSFHFEFAPGETRFILLAPFAEELINRIHTKGGAVVFFSANGDRPTEDNLNHWKFGGGTILQHPAIAGVWFESHLVRLGREEVGGPILEPSKDLRIFDESLRSIVLVDDNPSRLFQPKNHRLTKKFIGAQYCDASDTVRYSFNQQLKQVWGEIEESVDYMRGGNPPKHFTDAYLPYSAMGQVAVRWLQEANHWDRAAAVSYVRQHPEIVDDHF